MRRGNSHTKSIRILHPVLAVRRIYRSGIAVDIIEAHIRPIHNVQAPERRVFDEEIVDPHFRDIPKDEGHRSPRLRDSLFRRIPGIAVAVDPASPMPVNTNVIPRDDESSSMILKCNGIGVVAPVGQVVRELAMVSTHFSKEDRTTRVSSTSPPIMRSTHRPFTSPLDDHIIDGRIQPGSDPIGLVFRKDDGTAVTAGLKGFQDIGNIVFLMAPRRDGADRTTMVPGISQCWTDREGQYQ